MKTAYLTRRELMRWLAVGGATSVAGPALAATLEACSSSSTPAPKTGGTVSFAISSEPKVLNPPLRMLQVELTVISLIFSGLLRMNRDGSFDHDLAESHTVEDGGRRYRFKLRRGLKWQDGSPLTAADFLFTYQTYVDPKTNPAYLIGWDKIDSVETPDETTVVYHLREVFAPFLLDVGTNAVLPRHVLAATTNIRQDPFSRNPVGCGPFKLKDWQSGSSILLEANAHYWRGRPKLDRLLLKVVPDANTQIAQLETGELDITSVGEPAQWQRVKSLRGVATALYGETKYALVQLGEYRFLKEVAVRQALDYATPKDDIIHGILRNLAVPALADVPPGSPYYNSHITRRGYDLKKASALLAEAGFTMQNGVLTRDGQPLEVPIYAIATVPVYVQVAQVLKDTWSRIGVKTSVTTMEQSTLFSDKGPVWNGKDSAIVFSWGQGFDPYNYVNWSSKQIPNNSEEAGENLERYSNPLVDELVVKGVQTADLGQRKKIYDQLQEILVQDVPVIFLYWPMALYAYNSKLRGFTPGTFSGVFANVWNWTKS
jgi:peptide/nickel transport system substrate-binding protein